MLGWTGAELKGRVGLHGAEEGGCGSLLPGQGWKSSDFIREVRRVLDTAGRKQAHLGTQLPYRNQPQWLLSVVEGNSGAGGSALLAEMPKPPTDPKNLPKTSP